uniref:SLPTX11 n=1 Tax=Hemiscolopendra marginata TaxID=943146 RepID=A0A646QCY6_9MYRI
MMFARACPLFLTLILALIQKAHTEIEWKREYAFISRNLQVVHQNTPLLECNNTDVACAYLQVNIRGVNLRKICKCPNGIECPHTWDPRDGYTIPQGSEQYKFCSKVPSQKLKHCDSTSTAITQTIYDKPTPDFTNWSRSDYKNWTSLEQSFLLHCLCPEDRSYRIHQSAFVNPNNVKEFLCENFHTCGSNEVCIYALATDKTFFLENRCKCPDNLSCPSDIKYANSTRQLTNFVQYKFKCQ